MQEIGNRTQVENGPDGPVIRIRAPKHWWPLIFLPIWFAGWTAGGFFAFREFLTEPDSRGFLGFWLLGWLFGEVFAVLAWSWMAFGQEVVAVQQGMLNIGRTIGPWGIWKRLSLHECSNLRAAGWFGSPFSVSASLRQWGLSGGTVALEHLGKTRRFGFGLEESEARAVAEQLARYVGPNT